MKILLIGNHNGVFPVEITKKLREHGIDVHHVDFASLAIDTSDGLELSYADALKRFPVHKRFKTLFRLYLLGKILSSSDADIIHFHYARWFYFLLSWRLYMLDIPTVSTVYGSDYYRISPLKRFLQRFFFRAVDALSFTNEATEDEVSSEAPALKAKSHITRFGLSPLSDIDHYRHTDKATMRTALNLPTYQVTVACGYNANSGQQHLKIIHELLKLPKALKARTLFLFPMTYSGDQQYISTIKSLLSQSDLHWACLEHFLKGAENAYVRLLPDIMLNLQVTDQFSGSMQEHLYAENVVITGSWLPYAIFERKGIVFHKIDAFEELGKTLVSIINDLPAHRQELAGNRQIIYRLSSWENTIDEWMKMYQMLAKKRIQ